MEEIKYSKTYLVLARRKHFNGIFTTRVVAEYDNMTKAQDEVQRLRNKSSNLISYRSIALCFPII